MHIHDLAKEVETEFFASKRYQERFGTRSILAAPLLREEVPIGVIVIRRTEVRPFTEKQVALLKTFASQAVIAIENVRLFKELQDRTRELARSVGELKALGEVGQAVSSTLDLETVLTRIASHAVQLSGAAAERSMNMTSSWKNFIFAAATRSRKSLSRRSAQARYGSAAARWGKRRSRGLLWKYPTFSMSGNLAPLECGQC